MLERTVRISDAGGTRVEALLSGLTRIGGGDADVVLEGFGEDQLHVWDEPPRLVFAGTGVPPTSDGVPFVERELGALERIEWGAVRLEFHAAAQGEAAVVELTPGDAAAAPGPPTGPATATRSPDDRHERVWNRIRAGLYVDLGVVDKAVLDRWQRAVVDGGFSVDACAEDLLANAGEVDDAKLLERSGRLMRDFLMAPLLSGVRGATRTARRATRGTVAFLIAQGVAISVFALIVALCLFFVRLRGVSLDAFFDRFVPGGG